MMLPEIYSEPPYGAPGWTRVPDDQSPTGWSWTKPMLDGASAASVYATPPPEGEGS